MTGRKNPAGCYQHPAGPNPKRLLALSPENSSVSQSPEKGKAHNDLSQLQYPLQEIRQAP